jgi:Methyltransferase domain
MNRFRRKRFQTFIDLLDVKESDHILDVGGLPYNWVELGWQGMVTCRSLSQIPQGQYGDGNVSYLVHDCTQLPYKAGGVDVVYSNSLLEHVNPNGQKMIAAEIQRVARRYWVQIPHLYALVEPHFYFPFFWGLPPIIRRLVATGWTGTYRKLQGKPNYYLPELDTMHLLTTKEVKQLFPNARIWVERLAGFPKSVIAWNAGGKIKDDKGN